MPGQWDDLMKVLFQTYRQQLTPWLLQGTLYQHEYATELKSRTIEADLLWGVLRPFTSRFFGKGEKSSPNGEKSGRGEQFLLG